MLIDHYKRIIYVQKLVLDVFVLDLKLVLASISIFRSTLINSFRNLTNVTKQMTTLRVFNSQSNLSRSAFSDSSLAFIHLACQLSGLLVCTCALLLA